MRGLKKIFIALMFGIVASSVSNATMICRLGSPEATFNGSPREDISQWYYENYTNSETKSVLIIDYGYTKADINGKKYVAEGIGDVLNPMTGKATFVRKENNKEYIFKVYEYADKYKYIIIESNHEDIVKVVFPLNCD